MIDSSPPVYRELTVALYVTEVLGEHACSAPTAVTAVSTHSASLQLFCIFFVDEYKLYVCFQRFVNIRTL
jgi:hypothetical protein